MTWIVTVLSIAGVILNIRKNRFCFWIWAITNGAWCVVDFYHGLYSQAFLFLVYFGLALYGIWEWRKKK
jgi:nicotinamide riboside transporter PnuC